MKKILFFIQNFSRYAGSEHITAMVADGLAKKGYDVGILSICGENKSYFPLDSRVMLNTLINEPEVDNRRSFHRVMSRLTGFLRKERPDIVIDIFASLALYTIPLKRVFGFKNISWEHFNFTANIGMNKYGRSLALSAADQIITLTETDKSRYLASGHVHCPVDVITVPSSYDGVPADTPRKKQIITVGRLTYQKAFERLVRVWRLLEPHTDWELMIYGSGEEHDKLVRLAEKYALKNLYFMGNVEDIAECYSEAAIYVSTSRFEGLPMTMIEAQFFGLPIVTYDFETGAREIVTDGVDGVIVPRGSERDMIINCAKALYRLIKHEDIRLNMASNAKIGSSRFSLETVIENWVDIINKLS